jgi:integrase
MAVVDVDVEQQKVRLGTRKGSGDTMERELPISPLLAEQLRQLTKGKQPGDLVFHQFRDPTKPLEYDKAERIKNHVKKALLETGHNVRGYRLHVYRHAFATRLYHATKDLVLTSRSLGHRNLETTMIYVHLQPETIKRYDVQPCDVGDKPTIATYIAEGWELALQTPETVFFKHFTGLLFFCFANMPCVVQTWFRGLIFKTVNA